MKVAEFSAGYLNIRSSIPTFAAREVHAAHFASGSQYLQASIAAGTSSIAPTHRSSMRALCAIPRVSRSAGPVRANAAPAYAADVATLKARIPFRAGARCDRI